MDLAPRRSVEAMLEEFGTLRFEPYAPIRRQVLNILRAMNRARKLLGYEPVPVSALRLRQRVVKPFGHGRGARDAP